MNGNQYLTFDEFAEQKGVPVSAVELAARKEALGADAKFKNRIKSSYLDTYHFELISVAEFAKRKEVTPVAVYKKIDNNKIEYSLKNGNIMQIDWTLFKHTDFKTVYYKHRGKNRMG